MIENISPPRVFPFHLYLLSMRLSETFFYLLQCLPPQPPVAASSNTFCKETRSFICFNPISYWFHQVPLVLRFYDLVQTVLPLPEQVQTREVEEVRGEESITWISYNSLITELYKICPTVD